MDRQYKHEKKSIFSFLQNQQFNKNNTKEAFLITEELMISSEILKMNEKINELSTKINQENLNSEINDLLKDLEYFLSTGNNNKKVCQFFFNSKMFLQIIECLSFCRTPYLSKLLTYIEKMLKNKNIARYLSKNKQFIRMILKLMKSENLFEICIKICEELFINSEELIAIGQFYKELEKNYLYADSTKLHTYCRILAIMIFDHKKMEFKQIFKYKENLKIRPVPKVTTENQSICYHLPNFLPNLVNVLRYFIFYL
jgi:hypothetical protein